MGHTSGGQRAAEAEATAEQLAEWERRLFSRAVQLDVELQNLAIAAAAHGRRDTDALAARARMARDALAGRSGGRPALTPGHDGEGVTHTLDREPQWGQSSTHGPVLLGLTETRSLITPDSGDEPPFAAELAVDQPPHETR